MFFDMLLFGPYSTLILLPGIILGILAEAKIKATFSKFKNIDVSSAFSGDAAARYLLAKAGIFDVGVGRISGKLTDHYDLRTGMILLSDNVFSSCSIAAVAVAAHEVGHAIQKSEDYAPMNFRNFLVPVVNFGTRAFLPLLVVGILLEYFANVNPMISNVLINLSIVLYGLSSLFALITLPVEFNASRRAKEIMLENEVITKEELPAVDKVLSAAALTYIASFLTSLAYLLRFMMILSHIRKD